jgi:hypothetical protein
MFRSLDRRGNAGAYSLNFNGMSRRAALLYPGIIFRACPEFRIAGGSPVACRAQQIQTRFGFYSGCIATGSFPRFTRRWGLKSFPIELLWAFSNATLL